MATLKALAKSYTIASEKVLSFMARAENAKTETSKVSNQDRYENWTIKACDCYRDIEDLITSGLVDVVLFDALCIDYPILKEFDFKALAATGAADIEAVIVDLNVRLKARKTSGLNCGLLEAMLSDANTKLKAFAVVTFEGVEVQTNNIKSIASPKYCLTSETITVNSVTLYRIKALKSFALVMAGSLGGFIENESNLSQIGNCWVYGQATVYGEARISENATVRDFATVSDYAMISGDARIYENAIVYNSARVFDSASVSGFAGVSGTASIFGGARVYGNARVNGEVSLCDDCAVLGTTIIYGNAIVRGSAMLTGSTNVSTGIIEENALLTRGASLHSLATIGGDTVLDRDYDHMMLVEKSFNQ
jgi:carbonic anhydrase/acetyltransferase-like protein (isoleucine patch superfamily)